MTSDPAQQHLMQVLETALRDHQQGRLDAAEAGYRQILAGLPNHPHALHLLGVVAHQKQDHRRAIELIRAAIQRSPDQAAFHANLAEAHRAMDQLDEAVVCCRKALELQPDLAEASNNLGLALWKQGQLDAAQAALEAALARKPGYAEAHNNLANVLREKGHDEEAVAAFRQSLRLQPDQLEAHTNLGQLLLELGDPEQALEHCDQAVRLAPHSAAALNNLGNALRKLGRLEEAKQHYGRALGEAPQMALAYSNMGQALEEENLFDEAIGWFRRALDLDPRSARIHTNLARVFVQQNEFDTALDHLQEAVEFEPQYAEAHDEMGALLRERGKLHDALPHLETALQLKPRLASARVNLARCYDGLDRGREAEACFREALCHDPLHVAAHSGLAALLGAALPEADVDAIQQLIDGQRVSPRKQADLLFALANVRDLQENFAAAGQHAWQANQVRHNLFVRQQRSFDPQAHGRFVEGLVRAFDPEFFERVAGWGLDTELPVFHVGLPRSGKSLAESMLAAHPQVCAAGELRLGRQAFETFPQQLGISGQPIDCIGRWTEEAARRLAEHYLVQLRRLAAGAERVVDTMPHNYLYLGMIVTLFPRARIVHCRRDLRDTALACWMKNFQHLTWTSTPEHLAARIGQYHRIWQHWRQVLSGNVLEVDYEQMVSDPEPTARRLVEFAGLEWHSDCLRFLEHPQPRPASQLHDARPPFDQRFMARWQHYHATLGPLFALLPDC